MKSRYYLDDSLEQDNQDKWLSLIEYSIKIADEVEFNILRKSSEFNVFCELFKNEIVAHGKRKDKIYHNKEYIRLSLTEELISYIKEKPYSNWCGNFIEDISFLKDGLEFFATITHENYVIMRLNETDLLQFNNKGFHFDLNWPYSNK